MFYSTAATSAVNIVSCRQRKRINTEEKAKVVAAVGGTEFIPLRASHFSLG